MEPEYIEGYRRYRGIGGIGVGNSTIKKAKDIEKQKRSRDVGAVLV
jgi:hypothetical protein